MDEFILRISTGNAAFDDDARGEIARILRFVADRCDRCEVAQGHDMPLYDTNGNKVGRYEWTD